MCREIKVRVFFGGKWIGKEIFDKFYWKSEYYRADRNYMCLVFEFTGNFLFNVLKMDRKKMKKLCKKVIWGRFHYDNDDWHEEWEELYEMEVQRQIRQIRISIIKMLSNMEEKGYTDLVFQGGDGYDAHSVF